MSDPITMIYRNHRGEVRERTIEPRMVWWGSTVRHPEPGWLLSALDCETDVERDFALADCDFRRAGAGDLRDKVKKWGVVKPLEWCKSHIKPWNGDYHTVPTGYTIRYADENGWKWQVSGGFGYSPSAEAAMSDVQAAHESRILAALSPDFLARYEAMERALWLATSWLHRVSDTVPNGREWSEQSEWANAARAALAKGAAQ